MVFAADFSNIEAGVVQTWDKDGVQQGDHVFPAGEDLQYVLYT